MRAPNLTQRMVSFTQGPDYVEQVNEVLADGWPTGIMWRTRSGSKYLYDMTVDILTYGSGCYDVNAGNIVDAFSWIRAQLSAIVVSHLQEASSG